MQGVRILQDVRMLHTNNSKYVDSKTLQKNRETWILMCIHSAGKEWLLVFSQLEWCTLGIILALLKIGFHFRYYMLQKYIFPFVLCVI